MNRLSYFVSRPTRLLPPKTALASAAVVVLLGTGVTSAWAQLPAGRGPAVQPGQQSPVPAEVLRQVEDFYHFAAVANFEAARAVGQRLVDSQPDPQALLDAFNEVHARRSPRAVDLERRLIDWQNTEPIAEVTQAIVQRINEGRGARATDPAYIAEQIQRLSRGEQAFRAGVQQLRNSGEYAVPQMIEVLRDSERGDEHGFVRRAMLQMGTEALNPLLAAVQMEDEVTLPAVLLILGDLGYDVAVPFLLDAAQNRTSQSVRQAAEQALRRFNVSSDRPAADQYLRVAEGFFNQTVPVVPAARFENASIWRWGGPQLGLQRTDVPKIIFNEIMAMRTAGKALELGEDGRVLDQALSLWLAANYRREGELPEGEDDRTRPENFPEAYAFGAQAGVPYLLRVVDRAQQDRTRLPAERSYNTADLAMRAIESLQTVIGRSTLQTGENALTRALTFPDRRVRIEAAMALAQGLPTSRFSGQEQVVPLLADALSQTGEPTVLLVLPGRDEVNRMTQDLQQAGYRVVPATDGTQAFDQAQALPGVDVIILDHNLGDREIDTFLAQAQVNPKLNSAAKVILAQTTRSRYEQLVETDPTLATSTERQGQGLLAAVEGAREKAGYLPIDPEMALELATRAGELLIQIGLGDSVFRIEEGEQFLLASLDDPRPEIQMIAGDILALLDSSESQSALLQKAVDADTEQFVRISLYRAMATSAKRLGNRLGSSDVDRLLEVVQDRSDLDVQASAAEAVGALALPADLARRLIVEETRQGVGATAGTRGGRATR